MAKSTFVPQYRMIYNNLKTQIQSGAYAPGSQLPFERELCESYDVQRITVRKALDMLVQDGLIVKQPGRGSFVRSEEPKPDVHTQTGVILFVMNKSQNDIRSNSSAYNAQLFFLMEQLCRNEGYTLLYTGISSGEELHSLQEQYPVVGAFMVSAVKASVVEQVLEARLPVLCLNHWHPRALSVLPDNQAGIRMAVAHLAELGHRRIAFVGGPEESFNARERLLGFQAAINEYGLETRPELALQGDWTYESSLAAVSTMLETLSPEERPTALLAASDMMAIGAIEAAHRHKLSVPEDMSIIGFDNIDLCHFCSPQLTSAGPDARQMARVAVEHMLTVIRRSPTTDDHYIVRMPITFEKRASVAKPAL